MDILNQKYEKQCKQYVFEHYLDDGAIEVKDIVQEMLKLIWQSYLNGNGLSKVIKEQKLIPGWQLHLLFLNALRNLNLLYQYQDGSKTQLYPPEPARVVKDETGIIDYFYPCTPEPLEEEEEETKESKVPTGKEKKRWLQRIRKLREFGYSDEEVVKMLKPFKQEVLF